MKSDEWKKEGKRFLSYLISPENRKKERILLAAIALLAGLSFLRNMSDSKAYIVGDYGKILGFYRDSEEETISYPAVVTAEKGGKKIQKKLVITVSGVNKEEKNKKSSALKEDFSKELSDALMNVKYSRKKKILLPDHLSDGTKLHWKKTKNLQWIYIFSLYPMLLILLFVSEKAKARSFEQGREIQLGTSLPSFNDQILMMLESGIVLSEAFQRAMASNEDDVGPFGDFLRKVKMNSERSGLDPILVYKQEAYRGKNRALSRQAGLLCEYREKGSDFTLLLRRESDRLWEERKRLAEKSGKKAETKLVLPLSVLLVSLLLVTTAPMILET
ncbi:MAG: type II secretion system F family protein [Eubacteriales bacterium]|nr:type II secretion system F family protein [Eubacteriales bacterium]